MFVLLNTLVFWQWLSFLLDFLKCVPLVDACFTCPAPSLAACTAKLCPLLQSGERQWFASCHMLSMFVHECSFHCDDAFM